MTLANPLRILALCAIAVYAFDSIQRYGGQIPDARYHLAAAGLAIRELRSMTSGPVAP